MGGVLARLRREKEKEKERMIDYARNHGCVVSCTFGTQTTVPSSIKHAMHLQTNALGNMYAFFAARSKCWACELSYLIYKAYYSTIRNHKVQTQQTGFRGIVVTGRFRPPQEPPKRRRAMNVWTRSKVANIPDDGKSKKLFANAVSKQAELKSNIRK